MDKVSGYGSEDSRFKYWRGRRIFRTTRKEQVYHVRGGSRILRKYEGGWGWGCEASWSSRFLRRGAGPPGLWLF